MPPRNANSFPTSAPKRKRTKRAIAPTPIPLPPPDPNAPRSAARKVYDALFQNILELADRRCLVMMLRLERAALPRVVNVLYRDLSGLEVPKVTRKSPRRDLYCSAVRSVDESPPHRFKRESGFFYDETPWAWRVDPEELFENIGPLKRVFPRLSSIANQFPEKDAEDTYTILYDGDKVILNLHTHHHVDIFVEPLPESGKLVLPPAPTYPGVEIRHTATLHLVDREMSTFEIHLQSPGCEVFVECQRKWREFVYAGSGLDARVSHLDPGRSRVKSSLEETLQLLEHGPALASVIIPEERLGNNPDPLSLLAPQIPLRLSPTLHTLTIPYPTLRAINPTGTARDCIGILDAALPSLQSFEIDEPFDSAEVVAHPLTGMPKLRYFSIHLKGHAEELDLARGICGLGSRLCVYNRDDLTTLKAKKPFDTLVRQEKRKLLYEVAGGSS